jgi:hypothetical protein
MTHLAVFDPRSITPTEDGTPRVSSLSAYAELDPVRRTGG